MEDCTVTANMLLRSSYCMGLKNKQTKKPYIRRKITILVQVNLAHNDVLRTIYVENLLQLWKIKEHLPYRFKC